MNPIRVLYIHHVATVGGSSNSIRFLIQSFPQGTVEPLVLCPPGSAFNAFRRAGIRVVPIPGVSKFMFSAGLPVTGFRWLVFLREIWYLSSSWVILKAIRDFRPKIVHLNERGLFPAALLVKAVGLPVVMHARNCSNRDVSWAHCLSVRLINRYVDMLVAIDESVRHSMKEVIRCKVIYNPARSTQDTTTVDNVTSKNILSLSPNRVRVTLLSILLEVKGVWDFLEAAKILRHRKDIVFVIAGGNSRPSEFHSSLFGKICHVLGIAPDIEKKMKESISRNFLEDNVVMLGNVNDVGFLLEHTDINVFPSYLNGLGRSVFEAGAYGIPSVVALKDRIEDVVEHEKTGLIVPERDPRSLACAIERLADDAGLRRNLGDNAKKRFVDQFSSKTIAQQMLAIYRNVTGQ